MHNSIYQSCKMDEIVHMYSDLQSGPSPGVDAFQSLSASGHEFNDNMFTTCSQGHSNKVNSHY